MSVSHDHKLNIWVDADACPKPIKDILLRASERKSIPTYFVANQWMTLPRSDVVKFIQVADGPDIADDKIAEDCKAGDIVITADIPLALRVVTKGALALNPRGEVYTENNIKQVSDMRNFMSDLRGTGVDTSGPKPFNQRDILKFANSLDQTLTRSLG